MIYFPQVELNAIIKASFKATTAASSDAAYVVFPRHTFSPCKYKSFYSNLYGLILIKNIFQNST